uniref:Vascular permeability factor n=1 Tax=Oryctolagus cuniculus TaxID=9986 RepID=A0A5F9CXG9_RABIT
MSAGEGHHVVFLAPSPSFLPQSKFVLLFDLTTQPLLWTRDSGGQWERGEGKRGKGPGPGQGSHLWSQAAPMAEEGDNKPHEVVKFMEVYRRSYCQPIETLVDIFQEYPDEIEYIFKPSCVPLVRCGGCCNDESLECVPTEEFNVTMQIMRIKPHQGQHIGEMSFLQHNKCECRPKKDRARQEKKSVRGKGKGQKRKRKKSRYKSWSVPCGPCSERRKHLFVQDPQTCKCSCKNTDSRCKARQLELNERTCRLVPRGRDSERGASPRDGERARDRERQSLRGASCLLGF